MFDLPNQEQNEEKRMKLIVILISLIVLLALWWWTNETWHELLKKKDEAIVKLARENAEYAYAISFMFPKGLPSRERQEKIREHSLRDERDDSEKFIRNSGRRS